MKRKQTNEEGKLKEGYFPEQDMQSDLDEQELSAVIWHVSDFY